MCHAFRSRHLTAIVLIIATFLGMGLFGEGATVAAPTGPTLEAFDISETSLGVVQIAGEHFTPGGRVYIGIFDRSVSMPDEVLRGVRLPPALGRNGSVDPAAEPSGAGAFDSVAGQWLSASEIFYGRNGGLDPATEYSAGGEVIAEFAILCGGTSVVRAFDQSTSTWSNWVDPRPEC